MLFGGVKFNGGAVDGAPGDRALGCPVGAWYRYDAAAKTNFSSFQSFIGGGASNGTKLVADVPAGTELRVANRFSGGGDIVYLGADNIWHTYAGDPLQCPTWTTWNANYAAYALRAGGFVPATNHMETLLYLRTTDAALSPLCDLLQIGYNQGAQAVVVSVINLTNSVPVAGGAALSAGTYLFDTANGYRLEDGASDVGAAIAKNFRTQKVTAGDGILGFWKRIELEIYSEETTTVTVTPIIDDEPVAPQDLDVTPGERLYVAGIEHGAPGLACQAFVEWTAASVIVRPQMSWHVEQAGLSRS